MNYYIGWTLEELRVERRNVQELLTKGRITRQNSAPGVFTEFSEKEETDLAQRLEWLYHAIAQLAGATEEEIAAANPRRRVMQVCTSY